MFLAAHSLGPSLIRSVLETSKDYNRQWCRVFDAKGRFDDVEADGTSDEHSSDDEEEGATAPRDGKRGDQRGSLKDSRGYLRTDSERGSHSHNREEGMSRGSGVGATNSFQTSEHDSTNRPINDASALSPTTRKARRVSFAGDANSSTAPGSDFSQYFTTL